MLWIGSTVWSRVNGLHMPGPVGGKNRPGFLCSHIGNRSIREPARPMNMATSTSLPFKPVPIVLKTHHWLEDVLQKKSPPAMEPPSRNVRMVLKVFPNNLQPGRPVSGKVLIVSRHLTLEVIAYPPH